MCHLPPISTPLTCHDTQRHWLGACARQHLGRVTVSNRKHTHVYRPKVCPDPIRPAPNTLSIVIQPGPASQPGSQPVHPSPLAGRLKPSSQNRNRESVGRIDRLLSTTPGQISAQSVLEGCDLHHHLAHPPI